MKTKRYGLPPINLLAWGLHAPKPPWDLRGIAPLNNHKAQERTLSFLGFMLLIRSSQPDYSSGDLIPQRVLPSGSASALDRFKTNYLC
jgi:hypothetical protein